MNALHPWPSCAACSRSLQQRGLSLVEVMVAMVLGLVVVLGVVSVMANNRQNFRITESLSEMQDGARTAFELIARDVRVARDTGCGPASVNSAGLPATAPRWLEWEPVLGTDGATDAVDTGTAPGQRVAGSQVLQLQSTFDGWPLSNPLPSASEITTLAGHPFTAGDLVVICNYTDTKDSRLHRVTAAAGSTVSVDPETQVFSGQIARYRAVTWFIGNNGRPAEGGTSLYRVFYDGSPLVAGVNPRVEEILPGVTEMDIRFRALGGGSFGAFDDIAVADRRGINAVSIDITMVGTQARTTTGEGEFVGPDGRMKRKLTHVIALRNTEAP